MIDFDIAALRRIGLTNPIAARLAPHDRGLPARVASVHRTALVLHDGLREFPARPHPSLDAPLAVGDWVLFDLNEHNEAWVHTLVDPLNELVRRDAHAGYSMRCARSQESSRSALARSRIGTSTLSRRTASK